MSKCSVIIKYLRNEKGYTQNALASKLHLAKSTISMYESGDRIPPPDVLENIADIFGVSCDFLLGRYVLTNPPEDWNSSIQKDYRLGSEDEKTKIELKYGLPDRIWNNAKKPTAEGDRLIDEAVRIMKVLSPDEQAQAMKYLAFLADSSKNQ